MGNNASFPSDICLDDFLNDLAEMFPGLELQLEEAYRCTAMTIEGDDEGLDFDKAEPIMRHLLMQAGLLEMITRVVDKTGRLKTEEVLGPLHTMGIDLDFTKKLKLDDWKILLVAWVRRLQEEQIRDLEEWHSQLNTMQREQELQYDMAIKLFQAAYVEQLEEYYKCVEEEFKREEEYRRQWEETQEIQEKFYEAQQEYLSKQNALAERNFAERTVFTQHTQFINNMRKAAAERHITPLQGASKAFSFVYPASITSSGAPVSAGSMMPSLRKRTPKRDTSAKRK